MSYLDSIRWSIANLDASLAFVLAVVAITCLLNGWRLVPALLRESWAWMHEDLGDPKRSPVTHLTEEDRRRIRERAMAELEAEQRRRLNALSMTDRERIVYGAFDRVRERRFMNEGRY